MNLTIVARHLLPRLSARMRSEVRSLPIAHVSHSGVGILQHDALLARPEPKNVSSGVHIAI